MAKITVDEWELRRAQAAANFTQDTMVDGVDGAEFMPPVVSLANFDGPDSGATVRGAIRRTAYALLRAMRVLPNPVPPASFSNHWTHLGGAFNTQLLLWKDGAGYKRIAGGVTRTTGSPSANEVIATLPLGFEGIEDGKPWLVVTDTGVGRVDLVGRNLLFRTAGSFSTGHGYVFFDSVPGWR